MLNANIFIWSPSITSLGQCNRERYVWWQTTTLWLLMTRDLQPTPLHSPPPDWANSLTLLHHHPDPHQSDHLHHVHAQPDSRMTQVTHNIRVNHPPRGDWWGWGVYRETDEQYKATTTSSTKTTTTGTPGSITPTLLAKNTARTCEYNSSKLMYRLLFTKLIHI